MFFFIRINICVCRDVVSADQHLKAVKDAKVSTTYSRPGGVDSSAVSRAVTCVSYAGSAIAHSTNAVPVTSLLPRSQIA